MKIFDFSKFFNTFFYNIFFLTLRESSSKNIVQLHLSPNVIGVTQCNSWSNIQTLPILDLL